MFLVENSSNYFLSIALIVFCLLWQAQAHSLQMQYYYIAHLQFTMFIMHSITFVHLMSIESHWDFNSFYFFPIRSINILSIKPLIILYILQSQFVLFISVFYSYYYCLTVRV